MGFGIKDFTPEQLAKWEKLNPGLSQDLGTVTDTEQAEKDLQEAILLNTESWTKLEETLTAHNELYEEYLKVKKGKPLFQKGELLAALLFFILLLMFL